MNQNNQQRPTPETDAAWAAWPYAGPGVHANFARKLERQRDEARDWQNVKVSKNGETHCLGTLIQLLEHERDEAMEQLETMREAIKEAHEAIGFLCQAAAGGMQPANAKMDAIRQGNAALAKLQPFPKP